jgi:hypothetical protein
MAFARYVLASFLPALFLITAAEAHLRARLGEIRAVRLYTSVRVNSRCVIFYDSDQVLNVAGELSLELAREPAV